MMDRRTRRGCWTLALAIAGCAQSVVPAWTDGAPAEAWNDATSDGPAAARSSTDLAAGLGYTCAIRAGGQVVCWGRNGSGQLGDGTTMNRPTPVAVIGLNDAVQIATARDHACAQRVGGQVVCWGENTDGFLGTGDRSPHLSPAAVIGL